MKNFIFCAVFFFVHPAIYIWFWSPLLVLYTLELPQNLQWDNGNLDGLLAINQGETG